MNAVILTVPTLAFISKQLESKTFYALLIISFVNIQSLFHFETATH